MKLPSLDHIYQKTTTTLRRFPLTLFAAALATSIIIYLIQEFPGSATEEILGKIMMCGLLGIPLLTFITLLAEKQSWQRSYWWLSHGLGIVLLIAYYFTLPTDLNGPHYIDIYRYGLFMIGAHLLVAIGPYLDESSQLSFWQYNKLLAMRFLTALLFSTVLYIGLAVALLAIQILLGFDINYEFYIQLYAFIGIMFNTWFFLAGIPTSLQAFSKQKSYPNGLKVFAQNVLLPLVVVYVVILYLYMIKLVGLWSWPEGWVSNLVLGFSVAGILAILLLYPIRHRDKDKWINRFYTSYFAALIPLIVLLFLAIYRRVSEYGVTINRYFVIVLSLWLAGIAIYFLVSKLQNIKVIPGSLCVLAFVISFGPWGAFSVSRQSQVHRLKSSLKQNNILQDGKIHKSAAEISKQDRDDIVSIVRYLDNTDNLNVIQPWFDKSLTQETITVDGKDSVKAISQYSRRNRALELMGIDNGKYARAGKVPPPSRDKTNKSAVKRYNVYAKKNDAYPILDFNWFIEGVRWSDRGVLKKTYSVNDRELIIESHSHDPKISVYYNNAKQHALTIHMDDIIKRLQEKVSQNQHKMPAKELVFPVSNKNMDAKLYLQRFRWQVQNDSTKLNYGTFSIAVK